MPNPRAVKEISIHALREEGDHRSLFRSAQKIDFYPRPPRGGRPTSSLPSWRGGNFYPRPPRGGRQAYKTDGWVGLAFLSTPSARRATWPAHRGRRQIPISIHALREEGDARSEFRLCITLRFLSTPSARRATVPLMVFQTPHTDFYPRPPRGGRLFPQTCCKLIDYFYPRPPRGGRHVRLYETRKENDFYPRPPRGGRPTT